MTVNIDGFPFTYAVIMASERGDASGVPKMITDMARGDADSTVAAMLALQTPPQVVGLGGLGLALSVFCSEDANLTTEEATLAKANRYSRGSLTPCCGCSPNRGASSSNARSGTSERPTPRRAPRP